LTVTVPWCVVRGSSLEVFGRLDGLHGLDTCSSCRRSRSITIRARHPRARPSTDRPRGRHRSSHRSLDTQQLRKALPGKDAPTYLLHDRDAIFGAVGTTVAAINIQAVRTAPRSPWQNACVERVNGSIRRECLDHVIVLSAAGLQRVLTGPYCVLHGSAHTFRTCQGLAKYAPGHAAIGGTCGRYSAGRRAPPPLRPRGGASGPGCPAGHSFAKPCLSEAFPCEPSFG
jgi:integrase-like protein